VGADRGRVIGGVLLVWGILGVILIGAGLLIGLDAATRAETLVSTSDRALRAAADSTRSAADALVGVETGIEQATGSVSRAAGLADDASATLDALAASMSLNILGAQPLLPLAGNFSASADDAAMLADELDALGESLEATRDDTAVLTGELTELAAALETTNRDADLPPLGLGLAVLIAWVAVPTLTALVAGAILASGRRLG
jgi:hypothetical protein